jgi:signal transduction histidine kinase
MSFPLPPRRRTRTVPISVRVGRALRPAPQRDGIRLAALRAPLAVKLIGANLLVVAILFAAWPAAGSPMNRSVVVVTVMAVVLHLCLMLLALRPIHDLETAATRVWHGDLGVRVERSSVADERVLRVGSMFNILLDGLAADREHMRALAAEVIATGDCERADIARELHNSTAQRIAALLLQLSAAARDATDPALAARLTELREAAADILEEVRLLSHSVHSSVLDDLGLVAALRKLARDAPHGNGVIVEVDATDARRRLPRQVDTTFYRVAEEAVRNALRHGSPKRVVITLTADQTRGVLSIRDDGRGFDLPAVDARPPGRGLFSMRERVSLVDGWVDIETGADGGTTVIATVPLGVAPGVLQSESA